MENIRRLFIRDEKIAKVELDMMEFYFEENTNIVKNLTERIGQGLPELSAILHMQIVLSRYYKLWCSKIIDMIDNSPPESSDEQDD